MGPRFVSEALAELGGRAAHWTYVSSGSAYASRSELGADESTPLLPATAADEPGEDEYGEAKVACEQASAAVAGGRVLVARAGLIGGPGDTSGRTGYWAARAARDLDGPMLVPGAPDQPTQVIDVRDLASWLLDCAQAGVTGIFDAVGPVVPLGAWIEQAREIGGHAGPVAAAEPGWLLKQGVTQWMGPSRCPCGSPSRAGRALPPAAASGRRRPGSPTGRGRSCRPTCWPGNASRAWTGPGRPG